MRFGICFLLLAGLSGCAFMTPEDPEEVFDTFGPVSVTPANGVWDEEYGRTADPENCSFTFSIVRRRDGLLVKASVKDNAVVTDDSPYGVAPGPGSACKPWDDDTFQVYFDGDRDGNPDARKGDGTVWGGEYILSANGVAASNHSSCPDSFGQKWGGRVVSVLNAPHAYTLDYQLWFSWDCLGLPKAPADDEDVTFGFNAGVHDDDDGGRADRALFWKGDRATPYSDESKFGRVTLKGKGSL